MCLMNLISFTGYRNRKGHFIQILSIKDSGVKKLAIDGYIFRFRTSVASTAYWVCSESKEYGLVERVKLLSFHFCRNNLFSFFDYSCKASARCKKDVNGFSHVTLIKGHNHPLQSVIN